MRKLSLEQRREFVANKTWREATDQKIIETFADKLEKTAQYYAKQFGINLKYVLLYLQSHNEKMEDFFRNHKSSEYDTTFGYQRGKYKLVVRSNFQFEIQYYLSIYKVTSPNSAVCVCNTDIRFTEDATTIQVRCAALKVIRALFEYFLAKDLDGIECNLNSSW